GLAAIKARRESPLHAAVRQHPLLPPYRGSLCPDVANRRTRPAAAELPRRTINPLVMARLNVQSGHIADRCSGTWLTHFGMEEALKEAVHAVARGVDHGSAS